MFLFEMFLKHVAKIVQIHLDKKWYYYKHMLGFIYVSC